MPHDTAMSLSEARQQLLTELAPVCGEETVTLENALGRVLFSDLQAPIDVPAFDNSAMDGYAVRFNDLADADETALNLIGTAYAGKAFSGHMTAGDTVRIMTGAVLPSGADTVIMQEDVRLENQRVLVSPGHRAGQHVRYAGEALKQGKPALLGGKRLSAADLGLLASIGVSKVSVRRKLRVAFMSTGDELVSIEKPLSAGQIYDANRYSLLGLLVPLGVETIDIGIARDAPNALEQAFSSASSQADVIITSGGVSVGEADFVRDLVSQMGEIKLWKIKIKPGKPMAFGRIGKASFFGLPGNPVAVMVTFEALVRDALLTLMGCSPLPLRPSFKVPCVSAFHRAPGRKEFLRAVLFEDSGDWRVRLTGDQGSGILTSMSQANCFIVLDESVGDVSEGMLVNVQPFDSIAC